MSKLTLALSMSVLIALGLAQPAAAEGSTSGHEGMAGMSGMSGMAGMDEHAHHHHMDQSAPVKRSTMEAKLASIAMTRQDGTRTSLDKVLEGNTPTVLTFIYTSCTTVCPVTSMVLSGVQDKLGAELSGVRLVSVSIDPEYDTPKRLTEYSQKYGAKPQWQHYGGTQADSVAIQKVFGAFRGDKMNHVPLFFVNGGGKKQWLRLEGFPSAEQLVKDIHEQSKG